MILRRQESKFGNEPRADLRFVEDGIYPATFVKVTEEAGKYGPQLKWLFTLDEVNNIKIFVSCYTSIDWAPGNKLDSLLVVLGVDTVNNFDLSTFNTDNIQKGTKALLMVSRKQGKLDPSKIYLKIDKWLPYSANARGAEPLNFPREHLIMPEPVMQQQPQQNINVQYNNQAIPRTQPQYIAPQNMAPRISPNSEVNRTTSPNYGIPEVQKIDFSSKL